MFDPGLPSAQFVDKRGALPMIATTGVVGAQAFVEPVGTTFREAVCEGNSHSEAGSARGCFGNSAGSSALPTLCFPPVSNLSGSNCSLGAAAGQHAFDRAEGGDFMAIGEAEPDDFYGFCCFKSAAFVGSLIARPASYLSCV